jgi:hypothetical protein
LQENRSSHPQTQQNQKSKIACNRFINHRFANTSRTTNKYNRENLAILQTAAPVLSVEALIAQRRLEERYCLQVAQCLVPDLSAATQLIPFEVEFSKCLRDEAAEKEK